MTDLHPMQWALIALLIFGIFQVVSVLKKERERVRNFLDPESPWKRRLLGSIAFSIIAVPLSIALSKAAGGWIPLAQAFGFASLVVSGGGVVVLLLAYGSVMFRAKEKPVPSKWDHGMYMRCENCEEVVQLIRAYGMIDGAHHKQWLLNRIVQVILEDYDGAYVEWVRSQDSWDVGQAP